MKLFASLIVIVAALAFALPSVTVASKVAEDSLSKTITKNGQTTYIRKYTLYGVIPAASLCIPLEQFCGGTDESGRSSSSSLSCFSAREALSAAIGVFGIQASLRASEGEDGLVNKINMRAVAQAGAMAVAFSSSTSGTVTTAGASVESESDARSTFFRKLIARAAAESSAEANSIAIAEATAVSISKGAAGALSGAKVFVKGSGIERFRGIVGSSVGAFVDASSSTSVVSISVAAADAYSASLARARAKWRSRKEYEAEYEDAAALADAFGESVSSGLSSVGVIALADAVVQDEDEGAKVALRGFEDSGAILSVQCGAF